MNGNHFAGTGKLLKFYLRRDRIILPIWILLPVILIMGQISFTKAMPDWQMFLDELSESPVTASSTFGHMNALWASAIVKLGNQEAFIAILIYMLGLMGGLSIFAITAVQRLWREEKDHYTEMVLSRPVSRVKWMGSHMAVAFAGSVFVLFSLGTATGLGWSIVAGEFSHFPRVLAMSISKTPSVWTIIGIAGLLYGWLLRIGSVLNWLILGAWIFTEMLWEVGIVGWSTMLWTPFAYAHYIFPIHELPIVPLLMLIVFAAAFTWLGIIGFKHRSIG